LRFRQYLTLFKVAEFSNFQLPVSLTKVHNTNCVAARKQSPRPIRNNSIRCLLLPHSDSIRHQGAGCHQGAGPWSVVMFTCTCDQTCCTFSVQLSSTQHSVTRLREKNCLYDDFLGTRNPLMYPLAIGNVADAEHSRLVTGAEYTARTDAPPPCAQHRKCRSYLCPCTLPYYLNPFIF
jgi:hypothetical protein